MERTEGAAEAQTGNERVVLLEVPKNGPQYFLADYTKGSATVHYIRIGTGTANEIVVDGDEHVTDTHCVIRVTGDLVEVSDNGHPGETLVDQAAITEGYVELRPSNVLRLGKHGTTRLIARGGKSGERPYMVGRSMSSIVNEALELHASVDDIAKILNVSRSTVFRRKAEKKKLAAAAAVAAAAVVGALLFWFIMSPSQSALSVPAIPSPAAASPVTAPAPAEPVAAPETEEPGPVELRDNNAERSVANEHRDQAKPRKAKRKRAHARSQPKRTRKRARPTAKSMPESQPVPKVEKPGKSQPLGGTWVMKRDKPLGGIITIDRNMKPTTRAKEDETQ